MIGFYYPPSTGVLLGVAGVSQPQQWPGEECEAGTQTITTVHSKHYSTLRTR